MTTILLQLGKVKFNKHI